MSVSHTGESGETYSLILEVFAGTPVAYWLPLDGQWQKSTCVLSLVAGLTSFYENERKSKKKLPEH